MNAPNVTDLDCRGLACPAPILRLAKAARTLPPGSRLRVWADDADFPKDLEAWCSSSKATLESCESAEGVHTAIVRLKGGDASKDVVSSDSRAARGAIQSDAEPSTRAATRVIDSMSDTPVEEVDCRGMKCPAPVLAVARKRRAAGGEAKVLHVLADDDDFPADLQAWAKSTGSDIFEFGEEDGVFSVLIGIFGAPRPQDAAPAPEASQRTTSKTPAVPRRDVVKRIAEAAPASSSSAESQPVGALPRTEIDARGLKCPAPILRVAKAAKSAGSRATLFVVLADDSDFPPDIAAWARSTGAEIVRTANKGTHFETLIAINGARPDASDSIEQQPVQGAAHGAVAAPEPARAAPAVPGPRELDARRMEPPVAILHLGQLLMANGGGPVRVLAPCGAFESALFAWASATQATVENIQRGADFRADVVMPGATGLQSVMPPTAGVAPAPSVAAEPDQVFDALVARGAIDPEAAPRENLASLLVLHNDFEKLLAAMMIANASAAQGMRVEIFFSFWGVNLLRGKRPRQDAGPSQANWMQKMMKMMMPKGPGNQKLSKMHMGGMGKGMLTMLMRRNNVMSLEAMVQDAIEQDIKFIVCTMSMGIMGIEKRDLMDLPNIEYAGVTSFVANSRRASLSLVF